MRLDKYLAETAQCTRSEAKALLAKGRVTVNGAVCKKGDTQLKEADAVAVDGKALAYRLFVYLMLNKPEGVVSASTDKRDTTVVDLVGDAYPRRELFPAGRLDKTSTGFVLLTDDGGFAHDILAPRRHVSKTYTVVIDTPLTEEMKRRLCRRRHPCRRHGPFAGGSVRPHPRRADGPRPAAGRACIIRSSGCSVSTVRASTPCTGTPSAGLRWTRALPRASGGS